MHHPGLQSSATVPARFRSWQALHQGRGWADIAYHYIIGVDGTVYKGRDPDALLASTLDLDRIDPKALLRKTPVDMRSVISNRDELLRWFAGSEFEDVVTRSLDG